MELDALAQARLAVLFVVLAAVAIWVAGRASGRRRQARFASLARDLGGEVARSGEFLERFTVEIDGRTFEVRCQHLGGRGFSGWYLVTQVPLSGVSDLHSAEIRARSRRARTVDPDDPKFEKLFELRDAGYPLREGWMNGRVRAALARFFALDLELAPLDIAGSRLTHRMRFQQPRLDGTSLRELLVRQSAVAAALEKAL